MAAPSYIAKHGRPRHPSDLEGRDCLGYAYAVRTDVWHFTDATGEQVDIKPSGPLRVTNADALVPAVLEGLAIAEFPGFIAAAYPKDGRMKAILTDWTLPRGALYFVMPTMRTRPAKVEALASFMAESMSNMDWS